MTDNVHTLKPVENPVDKTLIRGIEDLLERAKTGELLSLLWAGEILGNRFTTGRFGIKDNLVVGGMLSKLQFELWNVYDPTEIEEDYEDNDDVED